MKKLLRRWKICFIIAIGLFVISTVFGTVMTYRYSRMVEKYNDQKEEMQYYSTNEEYNMMVDLQNKLADIGDAYANQVEAYESVLYYYSEGDYDSVIYYAGVADKLSIDIQTLRDEYDKMFDAYNGIYSNIQLN